MNGSRRRTETDVILLTFRQFEVKSRHNYSRMPTREAKRTPSRRHRRVRLESNSAGNSQRSPEVRRAFCSKRTGQELSASRSIRDLRCCWFLMKPWLHCHPEELGPRHRSFLRRGRICNTERHTRTIVRQLYVQRMLRSQKALD